jgi:hypothetical protein
MRSKLLGAGRVKGLTLAAKSFVVDSITSASDQARKDHVEAVMLQESLRQERLTVTARKADGRQRLSLQGQFFVCRFAIPPELLSSSRLQFCKDTQRENSVSFLKKRSHQLSLCKTLGPQEDDAPLLPSLSASTPSSSRSEFAAPLLRKDEGRVEQEGDANEHALVLRGRDVSDFVYGDGLEMWVESLWGAEPERGSETSLTSFDFLRLLLPVVIGRTDVSGAAFDIVGSIRFDPQRWMGLSKPRAPLSHKILVAVSLHHIVPPGGYIHRRATGPDTTSPSITAESTRSSSFLGSLRDLFAKESRRSGSQSEKGEVLAAAKTSPTQEKREGQLVERQGLRTAEGGCILLSGCGTACCYFSPLTTVDSRQLSLFFSCRHFPVHADRRCRRRQFTQVIEYHVCFASKVYALHTHSQCARH